MKALLALRDRKEREATGLCLVEGLREIQMAIANGYGIETLYFCRGEFSGDGEKSRRARRAHCDRKNADVDLERYKAFGNAIDSGSAKC